MITKRALALLLALGAWGCDDDPQASSDTDTGTPGDRGPNADASADAGGDAGADAATDAGGAPTPEQQALLAVPETERYALPGLSGPAYVVRTEANVPHVYASNRNDLGRVMGFTLARDRLFFMDLQRRLALGRISALLGDAGLATDMESRLTGMTDVAKRLGTHLEPDMRAYLTAAAEGVNAYIEAVRAGTLPGPSELRLAGPLLGAANPVDLLEPFTAEDFAAMAAVLMFQTNFDEGDLGRTAQADLLAAGFEGVEQAELRQTGFDADVWRQFRPFFPDASSTPGFGLNGVISGQKRARALAGEGLQSMARKLPAERAMLERARDRFERMGKRLGRDKASDFGSNAWAVQGSHAADGATLVAGDGHLQLSVPSLMYQVAMDTSVFGGGDIHQAGLFLSPVPVMGAGTNGDVAWSMVNPVFDITDWYREEVQLGPDGLPASTRFQGADQPVNAVVETYEIANVPALGSVGRSEDWPRYETFDGRRIVDIEGRVLAEDEPAGAEPIVHLGDRRVVPGDQDGDGIVTAISFDHGAFDATIWPSVLERMGFSRNVEDFRQAGRAFVGGGLFMAAGDQAGDVFYSSYEAVPCRGYLMRDAQGHYAPGSDPNFLLDGTTYGAFNMPVDDRGHAVEDAADPYACVLPFDVLPQALSPEAGYVFTANNDPGNIDTDADHSNDAYYIGGPWNSVRGATIRDRLAAQAADNSASIEGMARTQADNMSRTGERFVPHLLAALTQARAAADLVDQGAPVSAEIQRLAGLWSSRAEALTEVQERLSNWTLKTDSGVETFYHQPTEQDRADAVATMIFNAWLPRFAAGVWNDEPVANLFPYNPGYGRLTAIDAFLKGRGAENPGGFASHDPETGESVFFDVVGTEDKERAEEVMLIALHAALDYLAEPPASPGVGGFGTTDQSQWLWGLRHMVRFESLLGGFLGDDPTFAVFTNQFAIGTTRIPLAPSLPQGDPRRGLKFFPRGADNWAVDAGHPGFSGTDFTYRNGPVMRMVIALKDGRVTGQNIIPGGQSALTDSPFFDDQVRLWLANETVPIRFHVDQVVEGATGREVFEPAAQ